MITRIPHTLVQVSYVFFEMGDVVGDIPALITGKLDALVHPSLVFLKAVSGSGCILT